MSKHRIAGSERTCMEGAVAIAPAQPDEQLEVSLHLRRRDAAGFAAHLRGLSSPATGASRVGPLARDDYAARFGAAEDDIAAVERFAQTAGLRRVRSDAARRLVVLSGTVAQFNAAFGVELQTYQHASGTYRGRVGAVYLPQELAGIVTAVLGLDNRPQARPHFRIRPLRDAAVAAAGAAAPTSFAPTQLAALYNFPAGDGAGQCIGIIELGGGYKPADLQTYFAGLGLKAPQVSAIAVDQGKNQPTGDANGADGEVMLDLEVAGAIAPAASLAVYFAPNTDAGFLDAITSAIHDSTHKPSVISISWGGPESSWTQQAMSSFDEAFQSAAALGITVCVAAGDGGSSDGASDTTAHVDFPASSPHALACGGTSLTAQGNRMAREVVWNDGAQGGATGGGVSSFFATPSWQANLQITGSSGTAQTLAKRGVPDVAGDADPQTGYNVRVDGSNTVIGGTSAVAPLWAGLIARLNALKGQPVGFINPLLYQNPAAFNDITEGDNGAYAAAVGWDACTGLGTPDGEQLGTIL